MKTVIAAIVLMVVSLLLTIPIVMIFALPTMWLWNDLVPGLFRVRAISYGEAAEMIFLCMLLIKSGATVSSSKPD